MPEPLAPPARIAFNYRWSFYGAGDDGILRDWVAEVKRALITVGSQFAAGRMVGDCVEQMYSQATANVG